jgi:ribosomal protein S18 acetylase RimI-like enzyme
MCLCLAEAKTNKFTCTSINLAFSLNALDLKAISPTLCPVESDDSEFFRTLYESARWPELAPTGWPDSLKRDFLKQQFQFQSADWSRRFPHLKRWVIRLASVPVGRLYIDRQDQARTIHLTDITLLPAYRGRGLGTGILRDLCAEADAMGWALTLHVEHHNPAARLYRRLGFELTEGQGIYLHLSRMSGATALLS